MKICTRALSLQVGRATLAGVGCIPLSQLRALRSMAGRWMLRAPSSEPL